jgi:hypothetical protein
MSDSISMVAPYDPSDPSKVLNPNAVPYILGIKDNVGSVPPYSVLLLDEPVPSEEELTRKQKAAAAVLLATGGIKPTEPPAKAHETKKPEAKAEEPKKKKKFWDY